MSEGNRWIVFSKSVINVTNLSLMECNFGEYLKGKGGEYRIHFYCGDSASWATYIFEGEYKCKYNVKFLFGALRGELLRGYGNIYVAKVAKELTVLENTEFPEPNPLSPFTDPLKKKGI